MAQGASEQMKAQYDAQEIEALLEECGFLAYEHLDHAEMTDQYFSDYNQRNPKHCMKAPAVVCYILAVRKK